MKSIPLTRGLSALVDDEDYERLSAYSWRATTSDHNPGSYYAMRSGTVYMHRVILGLQPGDGVVVDHVNGNSLDNRRSNLSPGTTRQNHENRRDQSAYGPGVYFVPGADSRHPYAAKLRDGRRLVYLGLFSTPEAASLARSVYIEQKRL